MRATFRRRRRCQGEVVFPETLAPTRGGTCHPVLTRRVGRVFPIDVLRRDPGRRWNRRARTTRQNEGHRSTGDRVDDEAAFEAFVSERWPVLVRSAVLLGCSRAEAEDVAQTTLVRCYAAWSKVTAADNRDGYVYRILVNAHRDSRRRRWWGEAPTEFVDRASDDGLEAVDGA